MPNRDLYHQAVLSALISEGWVITDDPLTISTPGVDFHIDIGAERAVIGAERDDHLIAVEIKGLKGNSVFYDFHQALGQFLIYRIALGIAGKKHVLYLAIPENEFKRLKNAEVYNLSWSEYHINLLVFDEKNAKIISWIHN